MGGQVVRAAVLASNAPSPYILTLSNPTHTGSRPPRTLFQDCVSHRRPHDCRGGSSGGPADNPHRSKPSGFLAFHRDRPRPTATDRVRPPSSLHIPVHLKGFSIGGEGIVSRLIRDRPRSTATVRVRPRPTATDRFRPRPTATDRQYHSIFMCT